MRWRSLRTLIRHAIAPAPKTDSTFPNDSSSVSHWLDQPQEHETTRRDVILTPPQTSAQIWRPAPPPASPLSPMGPRIRGPLEMSLEEECYCELHPGTTISVRHLSYVAF